MIGSLYFAGSAGWLVLGVGLLLAGLLVVWAYAPAGGGWVRWACAVAKVSGIGLLLFCLLEPIWTGQRARPGANLFAMVADNSESLQVRDAGNPSTRGEDLLALLAPVPGGWQDELEAEFSLRLYLLDTRLRSSRAFGELDFQGRGTFLHSGLRELAERHRGRPLAGVLLFTDGNATDSADLLREGLALPPVYPVVLGRAGAVRDVSIGQVHVSQTAFEDSPVAIRVEATATGFRGAAVFGQLRDRSGLVRETQVARARRHADTLTFQFKLNEPGAGLRFHEVRVGLEEERARGDGEAASAEATLANNHRALVIDHGRGPHRLLYVAGRPNWEYRYLNRALQEDDQLSMTALIRAALAEPKFDFRGRGGESSNPLYRGFGAQPPEEVERYDEAVLARLNTADELELKGGFPRTPEELFAFKAVILKDVEAAFFTPDQANLLRRFVSERGGGLLMLSGAESFRGGGYDRSPIGEMLPVYLDRSEMPWTGGKVRWDLAREGWLEAWARSRSDEAAERAVIDAMPDFEVLNVVGGAKPGASIIHLVRNEAGRELPGLVTQRFGRGRTAAMLVGDFWRWGMQDTDARQDMNRVWRQWARWLVADVPERAELAVAAAVEPPGAFSLQTRVRDAAFEPVDNASVTLEVRPEVNGTAADDARPIRLRAEPSVGEAGLYEVSFVPRQSGPYRVTAWVTNSAGVGIHRVEAGWVADPAGDEFRALDPNVALLEGLANRTGGQVVSAKDLGTLVRDLPRRQAPVMEAWSRPIWHTPWLFMLALMLLVVEWGLRRWKGLP